MNDSTRKKGAGLRAVLGVLAAACVAVSGVSCSGRSDAVASADSAKVPPSREGNGAASPSAGTKPVVLFVGTSLTAGLGLDPDSAYPMLIQRKIDSAGLKFEVVNAGVSGETSSGLLDRLDWLLNGKFTVMVLETGANDGLRGIPAATLKANLDTALVRIRAKRPDAHLVVIQMEALPNLGPTYAADFHRLYGDVAKKDGATLLPFLLTDVAGHRELNQGDGIHPNNTGERMVADNVWKWLRPVLDSVAIRRK
ncbi:MAG: arylesterase [Gemmatimonadaceae bacterium]